MFSPKIRIPSSRRRAFSLIEVTMALGLAVFAMTAILGVLPVGLRSVQDSVHQQGISNISRQLRAELQQIPFSASGTGSYSLADLDGEAFQYTREGVRTDGTGTGGFFSARLAMEDARIPGAGTATYDENIRNVTVTISYPLDVPEARRQKEILSLILARQDGN